MTPATTMVNGGASDNLISSFNQIRSESPVVQVSIGNGGGTVQTTQHLIAASDNSSHQVLPPALPPRGLSQKEPPPRVPAHPNNSVTAVPATDVPYPTTTTATINGHVILARKYSPSNVAMTNNINSQNSDAPPLPPPRGTPNPPPTPPPLQPRGTTPPPLILAAANAAASQQHLNNHQAGM